MAIIVPEVFADAVNARMDVALRVGKIATDYTDMVEDITTCGDTVNFPVISRIEDATTVTKGVALVPDEVNMTDNKAEIKQVGKAVRIYDKDSAQVKGALKERMAEQLGDAMAKAVDADLVAAIKSDALYTEDVDSLLEGPINDAFDVFGDDVDNDTFAGIIIHSNLRAAICAMDAFTGKNKTYAADGNGVVVDGMIGYWNGTIPVYLSNNGTKVDNKYMLAIAKKDALGVVWQKEATIEEEREAKVLATDIVANELYATKLVHPDGVSVLYVAAAT